MGNDAIYTPDVCEHAQFLRLDDGRVRKVEFYYGSGYLSQSSRKLIVPSRASLIDLESYVQ